MKKSNFIKSILSLGVLVGSLALAQTVKADTRVYELSDQRAKFYMLTTSTYEKSTNISKYHWRDTGMSWIAPSKNSAPVYRVYNPNSGEHFYTLSSYEKNSLVKVGWHDEGISFYSGGKEPVYRLYNRTGHRYTTSLSEVNQLKKSGWTFEGSKFYAIYPQENWDYSTNYDTYSGVVGDVEVPQFKYLNSSAGIVTTYQNNNTYAPYNNAVYNFNMNLMGTASSTDYEDWQARQNWTNTLNDLNNTLNQDQTTLDSSQNQVTRYQSLVNQELSYVSIEQKEGLSETNDQALLAQYQANLKTAAANLAQAQQTYQAELSKRDAFKKPGTDYVKLSYTISRSADNRDVTVNFTKTTQKNGVISKENFTSSAEMGN